MPHARLVARVRDRQEGPRHGPHRPQAQAPDHDAAARAAGRGSDDGRGARHLQRRGDRGALPQPRVRGRRLRRREPVHPLHAREGRDDLARGSADRGLQEAAAGRAADARELAPAPEPAVLRPQALRPHARRALQAERAPARLRRHRERRPAHPDERARAHHARTSSTLVRRLVWLPRRKGVPADSTNYADDSAYRRNDADRARARRVRALRQPPAARRRRADPGGLPHRPVPHGAGRARDA